MTGLEKELVFKEELERIHDKNVREFTRLCINYAPDYIFIDCPSSSSGKYHPLDELSHDGTIIHTKKVFTMAYELARGLDCDHNRDLVLSASLIHDLRKYGINNTGHTVSNHPDLAARMVKEVYDMHGVITEGSAAIISNCVGYHYGPWSKAPWKKDMLDYTKEELTLYISDYVVSKRFMTTDYRR